MKEFDSKLSELSLFICIDCYVRSFECREAVAWTFATVRASRDFREEVFDFLLHLVNINVAHNYDTLEVWTIPEFVVVAESLICEVVDNSSVANHVAFSIL